MHRVQEYLERAERMEAQAAKVRDTELRRQMLDVARQWRELARQAGNLAGATPSRPTNI